MGTTSTSLKDRLGVNAVERFFLQELGWIFREQTVSDIGIDAQVEVVEDGKPTGKLLALQIKSGASYFKKRGDDYVFYGDIRHLDYWTRHSLPVYLVLHHPDTGELIWQKIERRLASIKNERWSIAIPASSILTKEAEEFLKAGVASDPEANRRLTFSLDMELMRSFRGKEVYFGIDIWVNKTLGFRGIDVFFDDPEKSKPDSSIGIWVPTHDIQLVLERYFPWIEYEYLDAPENFSDEIDYYQLRVWLSKASEGFLDAEDYIRTGVSEWAPPTQPNSLPEYDEEDWAQEAFDRAMAKDD